MQFAFLNVATLHLIRTDLSNLSPRFRSFYLAPIHWKAVIGISLTLRSDRLGRHCFSLYLGEQHSRYNCSSTIRYLCKSPKRVELPPDKCSNHKGHLYERTVEQFRFRNIFLSKHDIRSHSNDPHRTQANKSCRRWNVRNVQLQLPLSLWPGKGSVSLGRSLSTTSIEWTCLNGVQQFVKLCACVQLICIDLQ